MTETDLLYTLALQQVPQIGAMSAKKLIQYCGSAEAVFKQKKSHLSKISGIGDFKIKGLYNKAHKIAAEEELKFIKSEGITVHYFKSDTYPEALKHCVDGPILLFQKGKINIKQQPIISIVGTRKITSYGIAFCEKLVETLSPYNPIIVSGFAYGADITAQKAAMKHNLQTIGCLAHGLNQIYPKQHKKYVDQVKAHGGFFTDFWSTDNFDRNNFLKRNRIIAGLSEATIVIESAAKGGSLVTADIAHSYDREVFAVPGRINDSQSVGCNNLIKYQKAHMLTEPLDVPYLLNWQLESDKKQGVQQKLFVELDHEEKMLYNYLKQHHKEHLDIIAIDCKIPSYKVASLLLDMELKGVVRPLPGKCFELC